jgi:hypothetical protein
MTARERPILFSAPMVRAILDGRKTQTRRVVKPQPSPELLQEYAQIRVMRGSTRTDAQMLTDCVPCPFGLPGNRLWVRETTAEGWTYGGGNAVVWYRADGQARFKERPDIVCDYAPPPDNLRWRPSIHMPRWASRITLEITDVRVQRLQEISDEDALAEGLRSDGSLGAQCSVELPGHRTHHDSPKECFRLLWESIHGPGSWDVNPFVWVIVFRRIGL